MAATELTVLKVHETSQLLSVNQSKVAQFKNNQYFDNVGKKNKIGNTHTLKQSDAPQPNSDHCKASDNERVRPLAKADDQPNIRILPENEVQVQRNHDIQAPAQARPSPSKPEAQAMVLRFGDFDVEVCYDQSFANVRKSINDGLSVVPKPPSDASQLICNVSEPPTDNQVNRPELNGDMHIGKDPSAVDPPAPATLSAWSSAWSKPTKVVCRNIVEVEEIKPTCTLPQHDSRSPSISYEIGDKGLHPFQEPLGYARFPVLDEDLIDARFPPPPRDYGGGRRLTVNHTSDNNVGQTRITSRGFPTPLQTNSNLMQSNVKTTSGQVPTNDTPKKPSQTGWLSRLKKGGKKTTIQNK